jgi:hypothetical protein
MALPAKTGAQRGRLTKRLKRPRSNGSPGRGSREWPCTWRRIRAIPWTTRRIGGSRCPTCGGPDPNGRSRLGESRPAWYPHNPSGSAGKTAVGRDDGWAPGPEVQLVGDIGTRARPTLVSKQKPQPVGNTAGASAGFNGGVA